MAFLLHHPTMEDEVVKTEEKDKGWGRTKLILLSETLNN
jgi:hypothetical protein